LASKQDIEVPSIPAVHPRIKHLSKVYSRSVEVRLFVLALALSAAAGAQNIEGIPDLIPEMRDGVMMMPSVERALEHYGYALTTESLMWALGDSRAEVRSLAAGKLASERSTGAMPALVQALSNERAAGTRIWIAYALATLGDERGLPFLQSLCRDSDDADPSRRTLVRLFATGVVAKLHNSTCNDDVIDILRLTSTDSSLDVAFSIADNLQGVSDSQSKQLREIAERFLADGRGDLRMGASNVLGRYGDAGSVRKLRKALATEPDVAVRKRMEAALRTLQGQAAAPASTP
jgi:HEAT repeat protein